MEYMDAYKFWCGEGFDLQTRDELKAIEGDEKEIKDRFYKDLDFGTGGLRGVMGAGTNRMNKYVIRRTTQGLADFLNQRRAAFKLVGKRKKQLAVAIAFDSRNHSSEFALEAALVLAGSGIRAYLFDQVSPTPLLSFTVRHLNCDAGIVVTASHNPKEYNGYKVYNETGCQYVPWEAEELAEYIGCVDLKDCLELRMTEAEAAGEGLLVRIGEDVITAFVDAVKTQAHEMKTEDKAALKIVYTPLHGSGNKPVRKALAELGYSDVSVVKEQELPDGDFSTVRSPNPEDRAALVLGMELGQKIGADIVFGTDPDSDRIGVAAMHKGEYVLLTGNQTGALLVSYVLARKADRLNEKSTICNTVVTSPLGAVIAEKRGCKVISTLTGFKYIGEQMNNFLETGDNEFVMGYEESYGYLIGGHARDKDAVAASVIVCEMAAWYKAQGKTLVDALEDIYAEFGWYADGLDNYSFKGIEGSEKMKAIMQTLREHGIDGACECLDYLPGLGGLPSTDLLKFIFPDGTWIAVRPSGTEPKIKFYFSAVGADKSAADARLAELRSKTAALAK